MTEKDFGEALSPAERRDSGRTKLVVDVQYDGGDGTGIANTRDIGLGGLYMTTSTALDIGMPIIMKISVHGRAMNLNGVIVYADPGHGIGVRFKDVADDDLDFLRNGLELT